MQKAIGGNSAISHREIIDGLKEALEIGTGNTVHALSQVNGYYENPQLRISLPQSLQKFEKIQSTPFAGDYAIDLKAYVTEKSIDGLFIQLAMEEAKIRNDPAARVTDLLKKVFR